MIARADASPALLSVVSKVWRFLYAAMLSFLCGLLLSQSIKELHAQSINRQVTTPGGVASGGARPPGITRSAENDEFGRGVMRALKHAMPASSRVGRVVLRLILDEKGKLHEMRVIRTEGGALIEQNVLSAAKHTKFPTPPAGSTVADRTFLVTYVYHALAKQ